MRERQRKAHDAGLFRAVRHQKGPFGPARPRNGAFSGDRTGGVQALVFIASCCDTQDSILGVIYLYLDIILKML